MKRIYQNRTTKPFLIIALVFFAFQGFSQTTYYPSASGGNWNAGAAWTKTSCSGASCTCAPSLSNDIILLSCNKTITAASTVISGGNITISGGTLVINSGVTLNCSSLTMSSGTLTVNGTLNINGGALSITGGTYTPASTGTVTLSGGAQSISSNQTLYNLNIAGSGNKTMLTNLTLANQLQLTTNNLIVGANTLTVGSASSGNGIMQSGPGGKITLAATSSLSLGGSYLNTDLSTILTNSWPLTIANFTMTRNLCTVGLGSGHNMTVTGAFALTAGDFSIGSSTLTLNGTVSGNINGEVIGSANSDLIIGGSGAASMYFALDNTAVGGSNTIRNFTNNRNSNPFIMLSSFRIGGMLTEVTGAAITITATASIQSLTIDGTVSGTAAINGNANASLIIAGSGNMGGTLTFPTAPTLSTLTMNRSGSGKATIGSAISVAGLALTNGVLTNTNLTSVTGNAPSNVSNTGGTFSYLAGALARTIAPNTVATAYMWPVGKSAYQRLVFNGISTANSGNAMIKVEAFDGDSGGTFNSSMMSRNTDNYWSAETTFGAGSVTALGTVTLNDGAPTLVSGNVIGRSATISGQYVSLGGSVSAPAITSITDSPIGFGFYNIGSAGVQCVAPDSPILTSTSAVNCGIAATTLSITSGSLNSATNWQWYTGSCDGESAGSGTSIGVSPSVTTTYYVRGEGGCVTPDNCSEITVAVIAPQNWYLDADNDGHYVAGPISQCISPGFGYNTIATESGDCDDNNIAVFQNATFYIDVDGDNYDNGTASLCAAAAPTGYSNTTLGNDCNDNSSATHSVFSFYVDSDGDAYGSTTSSNQCAVDANTPPIGYSVNNSDCDDNVNSIHQTYPFYVDGDHDGYGSNAVSNVCVAQASPAPSGYSLSNSDCDDTKAGIYQNGLFYVDADSDGYTIGAQTTVCYGTFTPVGYSVTSSVTDCDDTKATVHPGATEIAYNLIDDDCDGLIDEGFPPIVTNPILCNNTLGTIDAYIYAAIVPGATGYRWRVTTMSGPTAGQIQFIDTPLRVLRITQLGTYAFATTYKVEVGVYYAGFLQPYTTTNCTVSTPATPTQLTSCEGGVTLALMSDAVYANNVPFAAGYRFLITDPNNPSNTQELFRATREFRMTQVTDFQVKYNKLYTVKVSIKNTNGTYLAYPATGCNLTTPSFPTVGLQDSQCDTYVVPSNTTPIYATSFAGATAYVFQLKGGGLPAAGITVTKQLRAFNLNDFSGQLAPNTLYNVRVRLIFNSNDPEGPFGKTCSIVTPAASAKAASAITNNAFAVTAYPNPFVDKVNIGISTPSTGKVNVNVYDMTGRLLEVLNSDVSKVNNLQIGDRYPTGIYNVIVSQGDQVKSLRVIKR